jgi:chromosomal replication initiator protein
VDKIFAMVFKKYGIKKDDLVGKKRTKEIAFARHIAIYMIREVTEMSLPNIGKLFNRDHSTILSSVELIQKRIVNDRDFEQDIQTMKRELLNKKSGEIWDSDKI